MGSWDWGDDEAPILKDAYFCEKCGAALAVVGPSRVHKFDSQSGRAIVEWRLRCPNYRNRWLGLFDGHADHRLLPQRIMIPPSIDKWSGQKPIYALVDNP